MPIKEPKEEKKKDDTLFYVGLVIFILLVLFLLFSKSKERKIDQIKSSIVTVPAIPEYKGQIKDVLKNI
jgi:hypothetical protein